MRDQYGRDVDTLRIAVTEKNSFPALYDKNTFATEIQGGEHEILNPEEIRAAVQAAQELGVKKIKLVGGEPLEREDILEIVRAVAAVKGIEDLSMNTNGIFLKDIAQDLKDAGLKRINILLNTFFEEKYMYITGGGRIDEAMDGMEAAVNVGLRPVRVNAVMLSGFNDDEVFSLAQLALNEPIDIKYIELPGGETPVMEGEETSKGKQKKAAMPMKAEALRKKFKGLIGLQNQTASALYYIWGEARGRLAFLSPESAKRPEISGKLELTCRGILKQDILGDVGTDIYDAIKTKDVERIKNAMKEAAV